MLLIFDDGADDPVVREDRERLQTAAAEHGVRVEVVTIEAATRFRPLRVVGAQRSLRRGYLRVGLVDD